MGKGRREEKGAKEVGGGKHWKKEGTEEMDWLLKCLPCKHEGVSLIPQNPNDNVACDGTRLSLRPCGGGDRQISGAPWPARLAIPESSRQNGRPCLKPQGVQLLTSDLLTSHPMCNICIHTPLQTCMHTRAHTYVGEKRR